MYIYIVITPFWPSRFFLGTRHVNEGNPISPKTSRNHLNMLNSPIQGHISRIEGFYQVLSSLAKIDQVWPKPCLSFIKNWSIDFPSFGGAHQDFQISSLRTQNGLETAKNDLTLNKILLSIFGKRGPVWKSPLRTKSSQSAPWWSKNQLPFRTRQDYLQLGCLDSPRASLSYAK